MTTTPAPRLHVDEAGESLLVTAGGAHPAAVKVARGLAAERDRLSVVIPDPALVDHPDLVPRLRRWIPGRADSMRLIAPCAGSADRSGSIPAQRLGDLLDADVIAPEGEFIAVPGGTLFALPPHGAPKGQWLRFRPGRPPVAAGCRHPAPAWQGELADFTGPDLADVCVEEIPAGLWVRWTRGPRDARDPADLAYCSPVETDTVALVVSRPGDPPLRAADVRRVVEALPAAILDRLVVVPYGDDPVSDGALGEVVAAAASRSVRVRTGLPLQLAGRGLHMVAIAGDGTLAWIPFAREVAWRPHGGSRILAWTAPAEQLLPAGPGQLMLNERWLVEIIEAGLWIREAHRTEGAAAVRRLPLDATKCTVVIGVADPDQIQPPWRLVERMLRQLPPDASARLRLAVPAAAGEWFAVAVSRGCRGVLDGEAPDVLTRSGRLVPWKLASKPSAEPVVHVAADVEADQPAAAVEQPRRAKANELSSLLSFVDQIRRTPAWDELPAEGVAAATGDTADEEWWKTPAEQAAAADLPQSATTPRRAE